MSNRITPITICAAALAVAACSSNPKHAQADDDYTRPDNSAELQANALEQREQARIEDMKIRELGQNSILYFAFDEARIRPEDTALLDKHAAFLAEHPEARVRLEGHADERGTREYNMTLGERRAKTVQTALLLRGVPASQFEVISYGEEQPMVVGTTEASYAENRRVKLAYQNTEVARAQVEAEQQTKQDAEFSALSVGEEEAGE